MAHKIRRNKVVLWISEHDTPTIVILFSVILIATLAIGLTQPDSGPAIIRKELEKEGYSVNSIDFVLIDKGSLWSDRGQIYESSEPIEYSDGIYVNQWELKSYHYGMTPFTNYDIVKPYPEVPATIPVDLQLTITKEVYRQLEEQAGEQEVEEYIKQLIYNSLKVAE